MSVTQVGRDQLSPETTGPEWSAVVCGRHCILHKCFYNSPWNATCSCPFAVCHIHLYNVQLWSPTLLIVISLCCCRATYGLSECDGDTAAMQPHKRAATKQFHVVTKPRLHFQGKQQEAGPNCPPPAPKSLRAGQAVPQNGCVAVFKISHVHRLFDNMHRQGALFSTLFLLDVTSCLSSRIDHVQFDSAADHISSWLLGKRLTQCVRLHSVKTDMKRRSLLDCAKTPFTEIAKAKI